MSDTDYPSSSNSSHSSRRLDSSSLMTSSDTDTLAMSRSPSSQHCSSLASWTPNRTISACSSPMLNSPREPSSPQLTTSLPPTSEPLDSLYLVNPSPVINLPDSSAGLERSISPCSQMVDLRFGRCQTPNSPPANQALSPVIRLTRIANIRGSSGNSPNSSEEDEAVEAKRQKFDPDYQPSTASTSPLTTAFNSQDVSEQEEEPDETDTETDDESWQPSETTSPEIISSPEDD
jgi:hypothetical protein